MSVGRSSTLRMSDFDYDLPDDLIAQVPLAERSASRLMVVNRHRQTFAHRSFVDLPDLLAPGDLIVVNDSRVIPARLIGQRQSGGEVEFLLLREIAPRRWKVLMRPSRRLRVGESIEYRSSRAGDDSIGRVTLLEKQRDGHGVILLDDEIATRLGDYGSMPLPPYIHTHLDDPERYQTVYAQSVGSAAAPTAGLHFTDDILNQLTIRGVSVANVTLHVGLDTFRPVSAEFADQHEIHQEWFDVPAQTASAIARTRSAGGRIVAIGTTAARTLESLGKRGPVLPDTGVSGMTDIFITPGYHWTLVDAMVTNFHLPRSTLILMMSSFAGKELLFQAYREAIEKRYRFFSFGDAMLVE